ncbi:hypothetical protein SM0020_20304 [Sinorhizobium meliloti CCNWSX0020]|uniref:Uncharacterized protein n=1 Tax=Sinorhizobium meliloti CCNWSX0020 TaxID=1107881 RepID=H0G3L2_RHIML|nr:hypothetical protein SM0020_20304 [Sinorhizobium meliloti CCNWSX0020]
MKMPIIRAAYNEVLHISVLPMLAPDPRGRHQGVPVRSKGGNSCGETAPR